MRNEKRKSILVVEDETSIARVCKRTLDSEGYAVDIVENARIAEGTLGTKEYDLYLLDIRTPEMNGMELFQIMKTRNPSLARRAVFTTGDTLSAGIKEFLETNGCLYLPKPFSPADLRSIVSCALSDGKTLASPVGLC